MLIRELSVLYLQSQSQERLGEHLRNVQQNTSGSPVAEHFNSARHSLSDVIVRGLRLCTGSNLRRKQLEMEKIFRLDSIEHNHFGLDNTRYHDQPHQIILLIIIKDEGYVMAEAHTINPECQTGINSIKP